MECLECGEVIKGRADKKFCSDYCRNSYNNSQNKDSTNLMRNINNKLRKNYRILMELNPEGKTKCPKNKLVAAGFNFKYATERTIYKNGSEYIYVYDQGYRVLEEDWFLLVKKNQS